MANEIPPIPQHVQGMDPTQELQQWAQWRQAVDAAKQTDKLTGDAARYYNGPSPRPGDPRFDQSYATDMFSPEAGQTYVNAKTHFDINSGKTVKNQSGWDLPETKLIVALAAGLGGVAAAPLIAGAVGGNAAAGTAAGSELGADAAGVGATSGLASGAGIGTSVAAPSLADISGVVAGDVAGGFGGGAGVSTLSKAAGLLDAAGKGIGGAAQNAAQGRQQGMNAEVVAQNNYENQMLSRAREEQSQRNDALKQQYYANYVQNRKPGPFNTGGLINYGDDVKASAAALAAQAKAKLATGAKYDTNAMEAVKTPKEYMDEYGTPGTLEKISNWASPALSTLGKVGSLAGWF
jgi:hypothetical protein